MRLPRAVAPLLRGRLALRDRRLSANIPPPAMLALMYLATIVAGTLILRSPSSGAGTRCTPSGGPSAWKRC